MESIVRNMKKSSRKVGGHNGHKKPSFSKLGYEDSSKNFLEINNTVIRLVFSTHFQQSPTERNIFN